MKHIRNAKRAAGAALGLVMAVSLTACGSGSSDGTKGTEGGDGGGSGEQITLRVATFNEFGYKKAGLYDEYMAANPNVKIEEVLAAKAEEASANLKTGLAAGSGLADIEAIEGDWLTEFIQSADKFTDLSDSSLDGRWAEYITAPATSDGQLIGYATDTGPEAVCYRQDLFAEAGLPTDRDEVAKLLAGDWDRYFEVGKDFVANSDKAWFDSAGANYQAMVNQLANPYEEDDNTPKDLATNSDIKALYEQVAGASTTDGLSAHLGQWSADWTSAFQNGAFATMLCPAWMLPIIEGNAAGVEGWNVADVFPGGGGNWGGSYLTVPAQGKHAEEAKKLAAWLTAPEQTAKVFAEVGNFPSQIEAQKSDEVTSKVNPFFNDAPVGQIFAERAAAITTTTHKGPNYAAIHKTVQDALNRVDIEQSQSIEDGWTQSISDFNNLGL
ncbi:extracellular solute-binding protein [Rarobacter faecitabidus]|uniref:Cellobiose-binding protein n=2 Tax=Rarobacter faecitabidus TaxID=13243 RepID=A0A542ZU57_RARFA|nr:cellobiose-binding protein [Rarobacter faecitabidus]